MTSYINQRVGHTNERCAHCNSRYDDGYLSTKESDSTKQVIAVSRNHNRHIGQHRGRHEQFGYRRKERQLSSSCDRSRYSRHSDESSLEEDANSDRCRTSRQHNHRSVDESTEKRVPCYNVVEKSHYSKPEHRDRDNLKISRGAKGPVHNVLTIVILTHRIQLITVIIITMNDHHLLA